MPPRRRRPSTPTSTTTTTRPPGSGAGARTAHSGRCRCSRPTTRGTPTSPTLPADANSANYIANILANGGDFLHADFGGGGAYGIPYVTVPASQPTRARSTSSTGPTRATPVRTRSRCRRRSRAAATATCSPSTATTACSTSCSTRAPWAHGVDGEQRARWDLTSNALRPIGWTSADAAGLPIFAGLARYDEVAAGHIDHALRVHGERARRRASCSRRRTDASSSTDPNRPPMGLRLRLKARLRHQSAFHGPVAGDPRGAEEVRDDRRRQRLELVHHRRRRLALERRRPQPAQDRARQRVRGRGHRPGAAHAETYAAGAMFSTRPDPASSPAPGRSRRGTTRVRRRSSRRRAHLVVVLGGVTIAETPARVPRARDEPSAQLLLPARRRARGRARPRGRASSFCEWKGRAHYFDVRGGDRVEDASGVGLRHAERRVRRRSAATSRSTPGRMDACFVDGELVDPAARRLLRRLDHLDRRRTVQGRPRHPRLVTLPPRTSRSRPPHAHAKLRDARGWAGAT